MKKGMTLFNEEYLRRMISECVRSAITENEEYDDELGMLAFDAMTALRHLEEFLDRNGLYPEVAKMCADVREKISAL